MPEEDYEFTPASKLMQKDEIETLSKIFVDLGVNKIRLTGGEPLVRKDAGDIIQVFIKATGQINHHHQRIKTA